MDEREKRLAEKLGPHRVRLDELNQPWFVGDVTTVALMLWRECLRLMAEQEWVKVEDQTPKPHASICDQPLLVISKFFKGPVFGWYFGPEIGWRIQSVNGEVEVTHWREIGLPTEGGKE